VEELLAERGIEVDHLTIYRWVQTFTAEFIHLARPARHAAGNRWFVDETYVKVAGRWTYLYRAVDQHRQVIDVVVSTRRDAAAARTFFAGALRLGLAPVEVTTDQAPVYLWVLDELTAARHVTSSTRTTRSRLTTAGSKRSCGRCADSNAWPRCVPSRPGTRSCKTCDAATTRSRPTCRSMIGCTSHSRSLRYPSNRSQLPAREKLTRRSRNNATAPNRARH
jgi:transposase-like protein